MLSLHFYHMPNSYQKTPNSTHRSKSNSTFLIASTHRVSLMHLKEIGETLRCVGRRLCHTCLAQHQMTPTTHHTRSLRHQPLMYKSIGCYDLYSGEVGMFFGHHKLNNMSVWKAMFFRGIDVYISKRE